MRISVCFSQLLTSVYQRIIVVAPKGARVLLVFFLIFSQFFGSLSIVFAQEALQLSSGQATQAAILAAKDPPIPSLPLPFKGDYPITLKFGDKEVEPNLPPLHNGIDFAMPEGVEVLAVDEGKVVQAGEGDFGTTVIIEHPWGRSVYGHLKEVKTSEVRTISKGQIIGISGSTGITTGPHLHLGIKPKSADLEDEYFGFIDPLPYLAKLKSQNLEALRQSSGPEATSSATLQSSILGEASSSAQPWQAAAQASLMNFLDQQANSLTAPNSPEATQSAEVSPISFEDLSQRDEFLFSYKYDLNNGQTAHFYDKTQKRAGFAIADKDYTYKLRFFLKDSSNSASPKAETGKVEYPVKVSGVPMNLRYTISENRIKEEFVIEKNPFSDDPNLLSKNKLEIPFDVSLEGLTLQKEGEEYLFKSSDDSVYWRILKPTVIDTSGQSGEIQLSVFGDQLSENGQPVIGQLDNRELADSNPKTENREPITGKGTAILSVDTEFLKNASYPVIIDPTVIINTSSVTTATQSPAQKHLVRTSDGTLHAFIQVGTQTATCGGSSKSGLLWFNSTDSGATWTCQSQISSSTSMFASATVDTSDNIFVVYAVNAGGASANNDLFYQKLTKGAGATWTVETAQTVLDASASIGYAYSTIEAEGTTRLWLATRYYDGTNYQVSVYYSDGLAAAPTWTVSQTTLDTVSNSSAWHIPVIVRFGSKIGVIYDYGETGLRWRFRSDSDSLTSWVADNSVGGMSGATQYFGVGDSNGRIFVVNLATTTAFSYFNGAVWSTVTTVSSAGAGTAGSISTDGTNVWIFYMETTGLSSGLSGSRKLVYKKGIPPFTSSDFDTNSTAVVSYQGTFDSYFSYVASAYTDDTTDAGDTDSADVSMVTSSGDIAYFGKSETFDSISWDLSTSGVGGTITWEYCSAVDVNTACTTWSALSFTASSNTNFTADGWGAFTAPGDWVSAKVNSEASARYYIRARATADYTTSPVGVEMAAIPQLNWPSFLAAPASNTIYGIWTENGSSPMRVRTSSISVTASTAPSSTAELSPLVLGYSSNNFATGVSTQKHLVRTSEGTLHAFIQSGTRIACGSSTSGSNNVGVVWIYSTDSGSSWTCGGALSVNSVLSPTLRYTSATADSSDNIYVTYSGAVNGANANNDVFYQKLTKGAGATWTIGDAQTVLDGTASIGYSYATIEAEGTTRLWLVARYYDGTNYQISVYYSDGMGASPSWTQSVATLDTAGTNGSYHYPAIVRFGTNIGIIYTDQGSIGDLFWRYRADSDGLTSWNAEATVTTSTVISGVATFTAIADSSANIYVAANTSTNIFFTTYNGSSWSSTATVSSASVNGTFVSLVTDNTSVWVLYGEGTGLSSGLSGNRKLVYKKGVSPFATGNFDTNSTAVVSQYTTFDKVWQYASSVYADETTDASDTDSADVSMITSVGDIMYFGKTDKFDAVSFDLSTNGAGGLVVWEYYNGSSWMSLVDFYGVSNSAVLGGDGYITFIPPSDWATTNINGEGTAYYYIRARVTTAFTTTPVGVEMAAIPLINWATLASATTGMYAMWTEINVAPIKIRYKTLLTFNNDPSSPSSLGSSSMVDGSFGADNTPDLTFTLSDTDSSDTLKYQIQIDDSSDFGSAVVDYTSALAAQGSRTFTVGQAAGSGSYTTGSESQTLSDGSYYWRVRATDNNNATSSWATANSGSIAFKVDTTAPSTVSSLTSSSHTASSWSADNTIAVSWTAATDTGGSGVTGYSYAFDTTSNTTPDTTSDGSSTSTTSSAQSDGSSIYFHVRARDSVGNWGSASHLGPFYVDTTGPTTPGTPSTSTPTTDTTPTWSFTASTDSSSGLASTATYTVYWCTDSGFSGCSSYTTTVSDTSTDTITYTHTTALADGTWYFRVRSKDALDNYSSYSSSGSVVIDTTAPNSISLESPADKSFTTSERPTFKWKAATTGDSGSGLAKYKLHIDNGTGGDIDIDNIPTSRTTDYTTDKYVVSYSGFDDSDNTNNYLSLYTKSSSSWTSGENDGKLREGKRTWQVTAVDNSGNTQSGSRTLYVDFTSPTLSDTSVDYVTEEDNYLIVTTTKPKVSGKISDNLAYDKLEFSFVKQNYLLGFPISTTSTTQTKSLDNTDNATSLSFSFDTPNDIDYGKYQLTLTVIDKAGNRSSGQTFSLQVLSEEKARQLLAQKDKEKLEKLKEKATVSLAELEKKAVLRKEKEAAELEKALQSFGAPIKNLAKGVVDIRENITATVKDTFSTLASQASHTFSSIAQTSLTSLATLNNSLVKASQQALQPLAKVAGNTAALIQQTNSNISSLSTSSEQKVTAEVSKVHKETKESAKIAFTQINQSIQEGIKISQAVQNSLVQTAQNTSADLASLVPETTKPILKTIQAVNLTISSTILSSEEQLQTRIAEVNQNSTKQAQQISQTITNTSQEISKQLTQTTTNTLKSLEEANNTLTSSFETTQESIKTTTQTELAQVKESAAKQLSAISQTSLTSLTTLNNSLASSQEKLQQQISQTHQETSGRIASAGEGVTLVYQSLQKPIDEAGSFFQRVQAGADTFVAIVFDDNPTRITDVTIEEIGPDYAVISWKTNHFALGKVNYGKDLTYGNEVLLEKREKYHQAKLTGLKSGERYFFEVMSQNKNYAYDAYYSFETQSR